jgi:hypothetical protein
MARGSVASLRLAPDEKASSWLRRQTAGCPLGLACRADAGFVELKISVVIRLFQRFQFVDPAENSIDPRRSEFGI